MMFRHVFFSAPHRLMFAGGTVQILAAMLFWVWILAGRQVALPLPDLAWPPTWLHAGFMIFSVFPWFIFGFLMTAMPKWIGAGPLAPREYLPAFLFLAAGWGLFDAGLALPALGLPGLLLIGLGWLLGTVALARKLIGVRADRRHALAVVTALSLGLLGLLAYGMALKESDAGWLRVAVETGVWGCLAPIFFTVLHRMLPFFTGAVVRPYRSYQPQWALVVMLMALLAHGLLAIVEQTAWRALPDAVAAAVVWHLSSRWGLKAALREPMLAMLHLGFLWLGAAMTLFALQGLLAAFGVVWGGPLPLHTLSIGFFASILVGMTTRVTLGHSGRSIAEGRWVWSLFKLLQAVVVLRLAGQFAATFNVFAGLGWLLVFSLWASRYFPMYLRRRPDGQPG